MTRLVFYSAFCRSHKQSSRDSARTPIHPAVASQTETRGRAAGDTWCERGKTRQELAIGGEKVNRATLTNRIADLQFCIEDRVPAFLVIDHAPAFCQSPFSARCTQSADDISTSKSAVRRVPIAAEQTRRPISRASLSAQWVICRTELETDAQHTVGRRNRRTGSLGRDQPVRIILLAPR